MTKQLREMIMNRSWCKNAYFKIKQLQIGKNIENLETTVLQLRKKFKGSILKTLILILSMRTKHF